MQRCLPGVSHPNAPIDRATTAKRFGVSADQVEQWLIEGLPIDEAGFIDPFVCCNWLSWGPLDTAPRLKRLWRQFLAHFRPFILGKNDEKRITWKRETVVHLPPGVDHVQWFIVRMFDDFDWQKSIQMSDISFNAECSFDVCEQYWQAELKHPQPHAFVSYDISINAQRKLNESDQEFSELYPLFCEIIEAFDYHYRVHALDDHPRKDVLRGTCLDLALYAGALLEERGRAWRLCGGVIAHNTLLNAHHWIEVETQKGWVPFDGSIPAIARMLGEDWREWAHHYCGGLDTGRIALSRGPGFWDVPEQNFISAATGAVIAQVNDQWLNAWPCLDWVCGECDGSIEKR